MIFDLDQLISSILCLVINPKKNILTWIVQSYLKIKNWKIYQIEKLPFGYI